MGEINKQITVTKTATVTATLDFKWIPSETEPTTPGGYVRAIELDINLGELGKLWGYSKTS